MAKGTVGVRFFGDIANLKSAVDGANRSLGSVGDKAAGMSTRMKVGLAAAGTAVIGFGKESVDAFVESEEAQKRLQDAFERFPALADTNQEALQKLNSEIQKKTKYDDDALASGQAVIAQFGVTGKQLEDLTPLIADYASRTGKDIPTAAMDVGKAMLGNAKALKNIGIKYTATGDKAKDFANIQELLRQQVGGFAEKEGTTAAGKAAILGNQFGELQEKVGAKLVPALSKLADVGLVILAWFDRLDGKVKAGLAIFAAAAAAIYVVVQAVKAWQAAQVALNIVMGLNPIVLIIAAIVGFIAILVVAYQKVGWFRDLVDGAFNLIKTVIMGAFNWVKTNWPLLLAILTGPIGLAVLAITRNWDTIKAGVTAAKDWIVRQWDAVVSFLRGIPSKISSAARGMWDGITNAFKSAINAIIRGWNGIQFRIPGFKVGPIGYDGFTLGLPPIRPLARGGVISSPTLAMLGDGTGRNRREIATPEMLMRRIVREETGGPAVIVNVHGSVLTERDLAGVINRVIGKGIK